MSSGFARKRGSTWTAYFYVPGETGERKQRSRGGFRTKADAQRHVSQVIHTLQTGDYVERTSLTVTDYLLQRWLPLVENSLRPTTFDSYQRMLRLHIIPTIGGIKLQNLRAEHLDQLYADLLQSGRHAGPGGLAPKTVRYIHNTMHKALKDAERKGLVPRNVATLADPPKQRQSGSKEMKTWTPEELRVFLAAFAGHRLEAAYILAATTGMRRGEVLGVRWGDLDVDHQRLAVRQTVLSVNYRITFGTPKTARGRRVIALDPTTVTALLAHRQRQEAERADMAGCFDDNDLIFAKIDGSPVHPDFFSQCFDRTVAKLPIPRIRLHDYADVRVMPMSASTSCSPVVSVLKLSA
jgi:integrase